MYVIQKVRIKKLCSACNGVGHKIIDGNKFYCSKCNGEGYLRYKTKKEYQVIGRKTVTLVKSITRVVEKELLPKTVVTYNVRSGCTTIQRVPEHYLFATKKEAEARCKELNEEG